MSRNLSRGDQGGDVLNLQRLLNRHRDPKDQRDLRVDEDGVFGPQTNARVRAFQQRCGLDQDGIVGPNTGDMLLPERTITLQAVVTRDNGGFASRPDPVAQRSLFGVVPSVVRAGVGDSPP